MRSSRPVFLFLSLAFILTSCVSSSNIPLGLGGNPDVRKLNNEMSGKNVWINDEAKSEAPVTVRFALDTFFTSRPGEVQRARAYRDLNTITFRYHFEGAKRGAVVGGVLGAVGGLIAQFDASSELRPGEQGDIIAMYGGYLGALAGAAIGGGIGYLFGAEYHYRIVR